MNWITGPNRTFGVGETKSQNAVIKVYSAAELKNALTKIYQLPSGVGTIEIAGDITISEPIKLKSFDALTIAPREIIIQAVSGARIINGSTGASTKYNYNIAGYNYIPVFDFGYVDNTITNSCKYTFKDLTINSANSSIPFGSLIAFGLPNTSLAQTSRITVTNLKAYNLGILFGSYSEIGIFTGYIFGGNYVITDIAIDNGNVPAAITGLYLSSPRFKLESANISNYGVIEPTYLTANSVLFFDAGYSSRCFLQNINSVSIINGTTASSGNICIRCTVTSNNPTPCVTLINCYITSSTLAEKTQISTAGLFGPNSRNAFTLFYQDAALSEPASIDSTFNIQNSNTSFGQIDTNLNTVGSYQIIYYITIRYANNINNYIIKANVRYTGGVYVITSTTTESASEELTTFSMTFSVAAGGIRLSLTDTTNGPYDVSGSVKITGQGLIT